MVLLLVATLNRGHPLMQLQIFGTTTINAFLPLIIKGHL